MLFEINLVKDRVVPRNLFLKRAVIAGTEIGIVSLVALIILFMGLRFQPEIDKAKNTLKEIQRRREEIDRKYAEAQKQEQDRQKTQEDKARRFRVWNAPINFGAVLEMAVNFKNKSGLPSADDVSVRKVVFGAGNQKDRYAVRFIIALNKATEYANFVAEVKKLYGDADTPGDAPEAVKRAGLKPPKIARRTGVMQDMDEREAAGSISFQPSKTGCHVELTFMPANESLYQEPTAATPK